MTTPTPAPTPDDGYVAFNDRRSRPSARCWTPSERSAAEVINAMTVDAAAFGMVPGAAAAAGRVTSWADRSRAEMGRVVAEVTDLTGCTGTMRDMCVQAGATPKRQRAAELLAAADQGDDHGWQLRGSAGTDSQPPAGDVAGEGRRGTQVRVGVDLGGDDAARLRRPARRPARCAHQAYRERVSPTAGWLADLGRPTADTGAAIEGAAGAAERAQMVLAQQEEALARFAVNPSTTPAALAAAEAQALAVLNGAIGEVTSAYQGILPPPPTPAPVVAAGAGTSATSAGSGTGLGGALGVPRPGWPPGCRTAARSAAAPAWTALRPGAAWAVWWAARSAPHSARPPARSPASCRTRPPATSSIPPPAARPTPAAGSSTRSRGSRSDRSRRSCHGSRASTAG